MIFKDQKYIALFLFFFFVCFICFCLFVCFLMQIFFLLAVSEHKILSTLAHYAGCLMSRSSADEI